VSGCKRRTKKGLLKAEKELERKRERKLHIVRENGNPRQRSVAQRGILISQERWG
jgi:hypothetical protein